MTTIENGASTTPLHGSFYIPWFDPEPKKKHFIDQTNPTIEEILDCIQYYQVPPSPLDPIQLARSHDPRKIYYDQIRKITMESLTQNGRIVGGVHRLPPKPIIRLMDVQEEEGLAKERVVQTQDDGDVGFEPSGMVSWYHHDADMIAIPRSVFPTSKIIRSQPGAPSSSDKLCIDPLKTIGGELIAPGWRLKDSEGTRAEKKKKLKDRRFDPIQKRSRRKLAGSKKRNEN